MKSVIIFSSRHHGNTAVLVKAIREKYAVDLVDAEREEDISLTEYDMIGFASGIDFGKFYPKVSEMARRLPAGKKVYALYTCAKDNGKFAEEIREIAVQRGCIWLGKFGCKGFNTYGPWKLLGGMNKGHPSQKELEEVAAFYERLIL